MLVKKYVKMWSLFEICSIENNYTIIQILFLFIYICFSELDKGDSGYVVYFVEQKENGKYRHIPWGMVVMKESIYIESDPSLEYVRYKAIVLDQALKDIANDYKHLFSTLKPYSL